MRYTSGCCDDIMRLKEELDTVDAVVIGAGSGLSTSAGFSYTGGRFQRYFGDFIEKYGFQDMYSGGFYPFESLEEHWAYWSRYIYINRYMAAPKPVYNRLYELVKNRDYFVLTTNVDHQFQRAGFDKHRLFYTQGDYGLWQCSVPCHHETYDNGASVRKMAEAQGFIINENDELIVPEGKNLRMGIPSELVPYCPHCHKPMTMNLRCDMTFVQDKGWYEASGRYEDFLRRHKNQHILFLELGVGGNTPVIIKYPFWWMTAEDPKALYACINTGEAYAPKEIADRTICINGDIGEVLKQV
ncbi:MAG TPA: Sir2 silent information regulator family NAD-dependent deacetylase [Candidatus Avilachnospira avistercoris]|nr:Sir2 silent information regulator family NAD-dependent deacetylase [Candidatus Avilachnospira avistercoris]